MPKARRPTEPQPSRSPPSDPRRAALERALPHSLSAERAVLGSMLLDDAAIAEAINILPDGVDCFWLERHQRLYGQIVRLWKERRPLDGVVVKDELERAGIFEELGGYEFLGGLISAVPSAQRIRDYAQIVRDKHLLRQLISATHRVMDAAFDDRSPTPEVLDFAEKTVFDVTEQRVAGGTLALPKLIQEVFRQIERLDGSTLTGEPTGFYGLDEITSGFQRDELIIIAGRPSMGKTAFGLNVAENMALNVDESRGERRPVLFFSLEMSAQQVAQRILCSRARVDAHRLRRGRHSAEDMERLQHAAQEIENKPLLVDDTSSLSILELRARARMAYRKEQIRAIFVDYLQLVRAPGAESRQQEVAEISRGLKALAKELHVPVIAMAQLNRNPEDRSGNRPRMSDLRESGAMEQDADLIGLLHREAYYRVGEDNAPEDDSAAELIIAKQRNGPVGTIPLHFNRKFTRFDNPELGDRYQGSYEGAPGGPNGAPY